MKKFLLYAAAALVAMSANAQSLGKKSSKVKNSRQSIEAPASTKLVKSDRIVKDNKTYELSISPFVNGKFGKVARNSQAFKAGKGTFKAVNRRAGTVQASYDAYGTSDGESVKWAMTSSTDGGKLLFTNVIPEIEDILANVTVEYTISGSAITIAPQYVGEYTYKGALEYIYLFGASSDDGSISMTLNEDGTISTEDDILYGAFNENAFTPVTSEDFKSKYTGYYEYISKISYLIPGQIPVPVVFYEPDGLYLHRCTSPTWYNWTTASFMFLPVGVENNFLNYTQDNVDTWSWAMDKLKINDERTAYVVDKTLTGNTLDFSITTNPNEVYYQPVLTGSFVGSSSEPYQWSMRRGRTTGYVYAGGQMDYQFTDGSNSQVNKCDPANRVTTAGFLGTPTVNSQDYKLASLIFYQGKPAAPLYFEGISLWVGRFTKTDDFNLTCKIVKVTRDPETLRITLGDVIAQADVDVDDITLDTEDPSNIWALLNWNEFSVEDEDGMSNALEFIQIEDEFAIVFEGWNNGTFTAMPIVEYSGDMVNSSSTTSLYITKPEDEHIYGFFSNYSHPYVSYKGAIYGYLYTTDDTNITIPEAGGQVSINVNPMFSSTDDDGNPTTALWLADDSDNAEWLTIGIANEVYTSDEYKFDLVFQADALPAGTEGRTATLKFQQWGAQLEITVTQGTVSGINVTTKTVKTGNTPAYNLAGQRVNKNFKGIVVKDGKKFVVK